MKTTLRIIRWFHWVFIYILLFGLFFGQIHPGVHAVAWTQPVLHEGNKLVETWRFRDAERIQTEHISLFYPPSLKPQARLIAREAERVYARFEQRYGLPLNDPVPVFLFPDRTSLQEHFFWHKGQSASGVYYSGAIYLLNPHIWDQKLPDPKADPQTWAKRFRRQGPLVHEFAHLYLDKITKGNYPRWYTEAFAQWVEYKEIGYEWTPGSNQRPDALYAYSDLLRHFDDLPDQALAYRESFLFLQWSIRRQGEDSLGKLHKELKRGQDFAAAWQEVYGETPDDSFRQWARQAGYQLRD
ncbi:hypothetical protein GCM10011571_03640 [Marinithermofilum abyssi]|uniref:Peptidase MA-like domain-containing protein n=1 Tax=Marinithermofilum abyssi TaxID=1571185 RepID=A0A8J2VFX4_9BACL|nr:hypothetical protein [Marinithermofilum abyssi]GGE05794.1 hypothetical protein GCM10011571_03640 [Marinithermofilum abyssi]